MSWFEEAVFGFIFGAVIGSYLTCVSWRIPKHMTIMGRSLCPGCGQELKARWNVPILAWLILRGRAACCGSPISWRYPLIEFGSAATGAALAAVTGIGVVIAVAAVIILVSILVSVVTIKC